MSVLQPGQEVFSSELSKLTGLDKNVIRGWALAEQSGSAAAQRQKQGNNNWLDVGYFDSGAANWAKGGGPFSNPRSAAQATAQFLSGKRWGASAGIQGILAHAGKSPQEQIQAIAGSGWASSGYGGGANLLKTYGLVSGLAAPKPPTPNALNGLASGTLAPNPTQTVETFKQNGPQAALDIMNSKSPGEALLLYKDARTKIKFEVSPSVATTTGVSPNASGIVELAKQFLGTPYSWGGGNKSGPTRGIAQGAKTVGFDCSAFLQFLWAKKGVSIPRTTYDQIKAGYAVRYNQLKPGDAVFFGSAKNPHHVGMYIGHGQYIQSPHTGDVVKISNLAERGDFVTARRYQ